MFSVLLITECVAALFSCVSPSIHLLVICKIYIIQMFYFCTLLHLYIKSKHLNEGTVLSQLSHPAFYC